jgi:hypothetical protein
MPSDYQWMFAEPETATRREVFRWWEARRGNYNLLLLCVGVVTWILVLVAGSQAVKPGVDFEEPIAMIIGPPVYALLANICYTAGPLFDVLFYIKRPHLPLFKAGFYLSVALTRFRGFGLLWLGL